MATTVVFEERVEIPMNLGSLADFRRWAVSDDFPENGRIDYVAGRIEVDMLPEDLFCHGVVKVELTRVLGQHIKQAGLGHLSTGRTRVSCPQADLSVEPDIVFVPHERIAAGRVRLVPKATGAPDRYVELEGPPELVVEIVSDSSVNKDTRRLPEAYFEAGISEFWLVDARSETMLFEIRRPGPSGYQTVEPDAEGFRHSAVFGRRFRLDRSRDAQGYWTFDLRNKD